MDFGTGRGVTQGDPASPMIFNTVVDAVVRAVLGVVCGPHEARNGMGWASGERNLVFYADDGRIVGRDHIWVQDSLTMTVGVFMRVDIETNLEKNKAMVCNPGYIWGKWSKSAYKCGARGECGVTVAALSLKGHMERYYGISVLQTMEV